jgi:energy-coupling factor transporter ATP-binding protein EcfA2
MLISELVIEESELSNGLRKLDMKRLQKVVVLTGANGSGKTRLLNVIHGLKTRKDWPPNIRIQDNVFRETAPLTWKPNYRSIKNSYINSDVPKRDRMNQTGGIRFITEFLDTGPTPHSVLDKFIPNLNERLSVPERDQTEAEFNTLSKELDFFLGDKKFGKAENNRATFFGKSFNEANLSEGQRKLVNHMIGLVYKGGDIYRDILLLDEPETHLHPDVLLALVDKILQANKNGQVWIATHNIALIAHIASLHPYAIWCMEDGAAKESYKQSQEVVSRLFGGQANISKVIDYMQEPRRFETNRYALQCLLNPTVVDTNQNDVQGSQTRESINESRGSSATVKVLDYGAGMGRLVNNIYENDEAESLDYYAYDKFDTYKEICTSRITQIFGNDTRYFNDVNSLIKLVGSSYFDVVVMTNVLHEIDPKFWYEMFAPDGTIYSNLAEDGHLLIVEDQELYIGENAHYYGFILLQKEQLKTLFRCQENQISTDKRGGKGRLQAHKIPKAVLANITKESISKAISELAVFALTKIKVVRSVPKPSYEDGKVHSFWVHQLANASLYLDDS